MESLKKINKWMKIVGIISFVQGVLCVILAAFSDNDGDTNITHIGGDSGSLTVVSNINWKKSYLL